MSAHLAQSSLLPSFEALSGTIFTDAGVAISQSWDLALIIAAIIFMVLLFIGGVQYLTAAGNEDVSKKARTLLLDAVIGMALVVLAYPLGHWVISQFGLDKTDQVTLTGGDSAAGGGIVPPRGGGDDEEGGGGAGGGGAGGGGTGIEGNVVRVAILRAGTAVAAGEEVLIVDIERRIGPKTGTTDAEGKVPFAELAPGDYEVEHAGITLGTFTYDPSMVSNAVLEFSFDIAEFEVPIRISVLDSHSTQPVPEYPLRLWLERADEFGLRQFYKNVITGPEGWIEVGLPSSGAFIATNTSSDVSLSRLPDQERSPGSSWEIFISQQASVAHHIRVINTAGQPVADQLVTVHDPDTGRAVLIQRTPANGIVTINVQPLSNLEVLDTASGQLLCQITVPAQNAGSTDCLASS